MKKIKTKTIILLDVIGAFLIGCLLILVLVKKTTLFGYLEKSLPEIKLSEGVRGQFGIDSNINEANIDEYLNRSDTVYRDVRMLKDPAAYENIDGDSYLSGFISGFEVIPYPYLATVSGLPEEVGTGYTGESLFSMNEDGTYTANYEESMEILEAIFPKDKNIFIMCGAGGYAGSTRNLLIKLGWDESKVRNVGGYWYYEGNNAIRVKKIVDGKESYDFGKVPYHNIDFSTLTEVK